MKKRFLTGLIVITAAMLVCLSGCGVQEALEKKAKDKLGEKLGIEMSDEPKEDSGDKEKPKKKKKSEEPSESGEWFKDHSLSFTSQDDVFTFDTMLVENKKDKKETTVQAAVDITEDTDDVEDGYKKVTAAFVVDYSHVMDPEIYPAIWKSAFDRYTGTSFESTGGSVEIDHDGETYDISVEFEDELQYPRIYTSVIVTCPEDYDGTVFQIGYASRKLSKKNGKLDYDSNVYTIDELPYFNDNGHEYKYFALGEKGVKPIGQKMVEDIIDTYNGENEGGGLEWGEGSSPWNHLPDEEDNEEDED